MKATSAREVQKFTDIPNIGPRMAEDFAKLGLKKPEALKSKDPFVLYKKMCNLCGSRQDPCVLDTYMAAVDFMNGAVATPWWSYTVKRKKEFPNI